MKRKPKRLIPLILLVVLAGGSAAYIARYYHADAAALEALRSDDTVSVSETDYGWWFDGPSDDAALIFYPGAKVEETAYAPLLRLLAAEGMDACLVKMPGRLAFFAPDKAAAVMEAHDYSRWYIGGHSLGGAYATAFAAKNSDRLCGVILLGAYPMAQISDELTTLFLYGSEDGVLNRWLYEKCRHLAPDDAVELVLEGGNHAQFGSYGAQRRDGTPSISADAQVRETVRVILGTMLPEPSLRA